LPFQKKERTKYKSKGKQEGLADAELRIEVNGAACRPLPDLPRPHERAETSHGGQVQPAGMAPRMIQQEVSAGTLRRGYNPIRVTLGKGPAQRVEWLELCVVPE